MNAEISSAVDESETRTNLWVDSLMEENETLPDINSTNNNDFCQKFPYFSPDDTLSALFSNQSLHDTPRRRLSTFFKSDSDSASPENEPKSNSKDAIFDSISATCVQNKMENFTKIRISPTCSETFLNSNLLISPAPSSVFYDDDRQDSGYPGLGSNNEKILQNSDDHSIRFKKRPNLIQRFGDGDDGFIDEMIEIDENDSSNDLLLMDYCTESNFDIDKSENTPKKRKNVLCKKSLKIKLSVFDHSDKIDASESDMKRHKSLTESSSCTNLQIQSYGMVRCHSEAEIIHAVQVGDENRTLIGDFSRIHSLPLLNSAEIGDLKCIDAITAGDLFENKFGDVGKNFVFIDCRYPYEYAGGHIRGAINIFTKEKLLEKFFNAEIIENKKILIFYCEFSKERGPRMSRFLRAEDRKLNHLRYPKLFYPEIYLLNGGYKNFYERFEHFCEPRSYKPMVHEDHTEDLRKLRVKSKSWSSFVADKSTTKLVRRPGLNRELFN